MEITFPKSSYYRRLLTGPIKAVELLDGGVKLSFGHIDTLYIVETEWGDTEYEIHLPNGSYDCQVLYTKADCAQSALDAVVDFCWDNDISFSHIEFTTAMWDDLVSEDGEVIDCIRCGCRELFIPCTVVIKELS